VRINRLIPGVIAIAIVGLGVVGCGGSSSPEPVKAAAPAAAAPVAAAPSFKGLIVSGDVVRSTFNVPDNLAAEKGCVLNNRFLHNEGIVFRVKVTDPTNGQLMDDKAIAKAELDLGDGSAPIPLKYGGHPSKKPGDFFWTAPFHIPENYPSGKLSYKINVTGADGRTGSIVSTQIKSDSSDLVILDGAVPTIVKPAA